MEVDGAPESPGSEGDEREEVDLLAEEFLGRRRRGEAPTIEEYVARRPDLAAEIREIFPTLLMIEGLGISEGPPPPPLPASAAPGRESEDGKLRQIGEYRVLREIGRGGMGIVYEAEQESLGRRVAIKVLPFHSLLDAQRLERFQQEARAAAKLSHPNIVPVFGLGEHLGLHYFVMQYIAGQGLDTVIEEVRKLRAAGKRTTESSVASGLHSGGRPRYHEGVARIVRDAALALDHAHREGILHRDVKPSNLLLDATGHVWLADFGLAKSVGSEALTQSGDFLGTMRYMAPERFKGWSDPRSDVYSLGLTLYELLALRPAYEGLDRGQLLRKVAAEDPLPLRKLDRSLRGDLETIVLKACAKEPAQRYETALAMAQDVDRYLRGEAVLARRSTPWSRFVRWCGRNPVLAGLCAAVILLLLTIAFISAGSAASLRQERDLGRAKLRSAYLAQARALRLSQQPGQRLSALEALREASKIEHGMDLCDEAAAALALEDVRVLKSWTHALGNRVVFDRDALRVATANSQGEIFIRSTDDDRELIRLPGPGYAVPFVGLSFHPDGQHLVARLHHGGVFDRWRVWNLEKKEVVAAVEEGAWTGAHDFDPGDSSVLLATRGGGLRFVRLSDGSTRDELQFKSNLTAVALQPGRSVLAITRQGSRDCELVDVRTNITHRALRHGSEPFSIAWEPQGRLLAVVASDFRTYVWDAETGKLRWTQKHESEVTNAEFQPRGELLLTGGWDNKVRAWDPWTGRNLFVLPRSAPQFNRDASLLGTTSELGYDLLRVASPPAAFTLHGHETGDEKHPFMISLSSGLALAASCGMDGVRLWDLAARREAGYLPVDVVRAVRFEPDDRHLLTSGLRGLLRWPVQERSAGGRRRVIVGPPRPVGNQEDLWSHAIGDGGRKVAFVHQRNHGHVLDLEGGSAAQVLEEAPALEIIAYSPDGRWAAGTSHALGLVVIWDPASGKKVATLESNCGHLQFDPRARWLVVGGVSEYLFLEPGTWSVTRKIARAPGLFFSGPVAFDAGGELAALAHSDTRIWLVEAATGRRVAELEAPDPRLVNGLALDLSSGFLAACTIGQRCHVWDLRALAESLRAEGLPWELKCPPPSMIRQPLQVDVLLDASEGPGAGALEDPRDPPLLRAHRKAALNPQLQSYSDIDVALDAPGFLVAEGAVGRYLRGLVEPSPGLEWTAVELDDSSWASGSGGFSGYPPEAEDGEAGLSLGDQVGSFSTLYVRHAFELSGQRRFEKLHLAVRFEDGFVAYLNGKEIARRGAGLAGHGPSHDARGPELLPEVRQEALFPAPASLLVPGKNVLALKVVAGSPRSTLFLSAVLAGVRELNESQDLDRTANLARGADGARDLVLESYRRGRILQRAGKIDQALTAFAEAAALDPRSPEPVLRILECRTREGAATAERLAREALEKGSFLLAGQLWTRWLGLALQNPARPLAEVLSDWPRTSGLTAAQGADLRSNVEQLARSGALRLRCGGPGFVSRAGKVWSEDRFFLGGSGFSDAPPESAAPAMQGSDEEALYSVSRTFPGGRQVRPAYRIPVPPGHYRVSLHFAERSSREPGRRMFGIFLERQLVLESHEPLQAGFATADVRVFETRVTDGFLDLDFLALRANPRICGIELERVGG